MKARISRNVGRMVLIIAAVPLLYVAYTTFMFSRMGFPEAKTDANQAALDHALTTIVLGDLLFVAISVALAILAWGLIKDNRKSQIVGAISAVALLAVFMTQFR